MQDYKLTNGPVSLSTSIGPGQVSGMEVETPKSRIALGTADRWTQSTSVISILKSENSDQTVSFKKKVVLVNRTRIRINFVLCFQDDNAIPWGIKP